MYLPATLYVLLSHHHLLSVPEGAEELGDELMGAAQHDALLAEDVLLLLRLHDVLRGWCTHLFFCCKKHDEFPQAFCYPFGVALG